MYPAGGFPSPVGSFTIPVAPPGVDPDAEPLVYIGINCAWLPYITGALTQLLLQSTWDVNTLTALENVRGQATDLMNLFNCAVAPRKDDFLRGSSGPSEDDFMIRQDPDNPCLLQTSIDGINWCTFADFSKCLPPPQQQGPPVGQPQPGECRTFLSRLPANGAYVIPVPLSDGDTVDISEVDGATNDNTVTWWTQDGRIYFAGEPNGPIVYVPGDPVAFAPHASIIGTFDGSTFFGVGTGLFTVSGGIVKQQLTLYVNFPMDLPRNGEYTFTTVVCNNQAPTFTHTFDFTEGTDGWEVRDEGAWSPGIGFVDGTVTYTGTVYRGSDIQSLGATAFTLTRMTAYGSAVLGVDPLVFGVGASVPGAYIASQTPVAGEQIVDTGPISVPVVTDLFCDLIPGRQLATDPGGSCIISRIVITGEGIDPYL